jgi:hypothetical protein
MAWAGLISDYSVRKLTYPADQFPALAGLEAVSGELNTYDKCVSELQPLLLWTQSLSHDFAKSASTPASPD